MRQLRDAKIKPLVEAFDDEMLEIYAEACGWVLARADSKAGDAATIGGYLGTSDQFDGAMAKFALAYADQAEHDHAALKAAVRKGKITAFQEGRRRLQCRPALGRCDDGSLAWPHSHGLHNALQVCQPSLLIQRTLKCQPVRAYSAIRSDGSHPT